jgi:membrane-associated phospholipid phosphatase
MPTRHEVADDDWAATPDSLARRLMLAGAGFAAAAVPVTLLGYAATHGWAPLRSLDTGVADSLHGWALRTPGVVTFLDGVSTVFDPWVLRLGAVVGVAILVVRGRRLLALWIAVTIVGAGVLGLLLKELVRRARPDLADAVAVAPGYSFPSGHALNSLVAAGVVMLLVAPMVSRSWRYVVWGAGVALVVTVGFARVGLGVHYLSDVVAGWLVGLGWLVVAAVAFESWRRAGGMPAHDPSAVVEEGLDAQVSHAPGE